MPKDNIDKVLKVRFKDLTFFPLYITENKILFIKLFTNRYIIDIINL